MNKKDTKQTQNKPMETTLLEQVIYIIMEHFFTRRTHPRKIMFSLQKLMNIQSRIIKLFISIL